MKRFAIFHRHGHRAPAKNIFNTKEEVDLWTSFCYRQSDKSMLNTRYPVVQHLENAAPPDVTHEPFGCLSVLGSNHLTKVGASIGKRFPSLAQLHNMSDNPVITAVSTNYSRTQQSAQSLLKGLNTTFYNTTTITDKVPIYVGHAKECPLNIVDRIPQLCKKMLMKIQNSEDFVKDEQDVFHVTEDLLKLFPGLSNQENAFNWMAALDYYSCRQAHGIPLHPLAVEHEEIVRRRLCARYASYFSDPYFLSYFVTPMLREIILMLDPLTPLPVVGRSGDSAHDVTLLGLLHGLKANVVYDSPDHWPDYGSHMIFEFHCDGPKEPYVEVYFNLEPMTMGPKSQTTLTLSELTSYYDSLMPFQTVEI